MRWQPAMLVHSLLTSNNENRKDYIGSRYKPSYVRDKMEIVDTMGIYFVIDYTVGGNG